MLEGGLARGAEARTAAAAAPTAALGSLPACTDRLRRSPPPFYAAPGWESPTVSYRKQNFRLRCAARGRYIFAIPSLMLVLLPIASPVCERRNMTTIRAQYMNVIGVDIKHVENISERQFGKKCCKDEEHKNLSMRYLCNVTMEIKSLCQMGCDLQNQVKEAKINKSFRCKIYRLSDNMKYALGCNCVKAGERCNGIHRETSSKKKCSQSLCELKKAISGLRSCWNKLADISENITLPENTC
ncbi:interleukin-7 isoform X2 [Rhinatrema bivittatum]|uniref:interleukin-7 isoform X2 n=1 Tax=Rhinatrema bivittatum TaxID=194408 RepID=UPI00112E138D|nr:interleukin-7 isoform X2 [Rhinatrema bivittatum]